MIFISIGGQNGDSYSVEDIKKGILKYSKIDDRGRQSVKRIAYNDTALSAFEQALLNINANGWQAYYANTSTVDGTNWRIKIGTERLNIHSGGRNAYPDGFDEFLKATRDLLGGLSFE